jgi:hypothetical protein
MISPRKGNKKTRGCKGWKDLPFADRRGQEHSSIFAKKLDKFRTNVII